MVRATYSAEISRVDGLFTIAVHPGLRNLRVLGMSIAELNHSPYRLQTLPPDGRYIAPPFARLAMEGNLGLNGLAHHVVISKEEETVFGFTEDQIIYLTPESASLQSVLRNMRDLIISRAVIVPPEA